MLIVGHLCAGPGGVVGEVVNARPARHVLSRRRQRAVRDLAMTSFSDRFGAVLGRNAVGSESFGHELVAERAAALGRAGKAAEAALARLKADADGENREILLKAAAKAVWAFFVQREACGFRDQRGVIAHYGIPRAVLVRLGAR